MWTLKTKLLLCLVIKSLFQTCELQSTIAYRTRCPLSCTVPSALVLCMCRVYSPEMHDYMYDLIIMTSLFQQNVRNSMSSHKSSY